MSNTRKRKQFREDYEEDADAAGVGSNTTSLSKRQKKGVAVSEEEIELFLKTYNAKVLQHVPLLQKLQLIGSLQLTRVQRILVSNSIQPKGFRPELIEGPFSVSVQKFVDSVDGLTKTVYIFGEEHTDPTGACFKKHRKKGIEFSKYVQKLANITPSFIDFYIETPIYNSKSKKKRKNLAYLNKQNQMFSVLLQTFKNSPSISLPVLLRTAKELWEGVDQKKQDFQEMSSPTLYNIRRSFKPCLLKHVQNKPQPPQCDLIRTHFFDLRSTIGEDSFHNPFFQFYFLQEMLKVYYFEQDKTLPIFQLFLLFQFDRFCYNIYDLRDRCGFVLKYFLTRVPLLHKEYKRSIHKKFIKLFTKRRISVYLDHEDIILVFKKTYDLLQDPVLNEGKLQFFLRVVFEILTALTTAICDMYLLSRMFKKHKTEAEESDVKKATKSFKDAPLTPTTAIVYAGHFHSQQIRNFIQFMINYSQPNISKRQEYETMFTHVDEYFYHVNFDPYLELHNIVNVMRKYLDYDKLPETILFPPYSHCVVLPEPLQI
jgi:hypothetical protein